MSSTPGTSRAQLELGLQEALRHEQSAWEVYQAAAKRGGEEQKAATEQYRQARERLREAQERLAVTKAGPSGQPGRS